LGRSILKKFGAITMLFLGTLILGSSIAYATSTDSGVSNKFKVVKTYHAKVSYYKKGKITANGEKFNPQRLTVAHKSLPFGTVIRFTDTNTKKVCIARVNDRGPYITGREFDVSLVCAEYLGIVDIGVKKVKVEIFKS
jgi:rare lipoprotein A